ncbi:MAG TPA: hypothetical protein VFU72_00305 [Nitrolancea sp.]|nr:hypothetical protein [Nitrolancea sp.]
MARRDTKSLRTMGFSCIVGAAVLTALAIATQVVQASTDVSKDQWSYPWSSGTSITFDLLGAGSELLLALGVLGLLRSRVAGTARAASLAIWVGFVGTALVVVGHLSSIPVRNELVDDGWPRIVSGVFGLGTVLTAVGFLLAGRATIRAGIWRDWRRFTPLAVGVWSAVLIGLQFTPALPTAVAVYGLFFLALGIALCRQAAPGVEKSALAVQEQAA